MARLGRSRPIQPRFLRTPSAQTSRAGQVTGLSGAAIQADGTRASSAATSVLAGHRIVVSGVKSATGATSVPAGVLSKPNGTAGAPSGIRSGLLITATGHKNASGTASTHAGSVAAPAGTHAGKGSTATRLGAATSGPGVRASSGSAAVQAGGEAAGAGTHAGTGSATVTAGAFVRTPGATGAPSSIAAGLFITVTGRKNAKGTAATRATGLSAPRLVKGGKGSASFRAGALTAPTGSRASAGSGRIRAAGLLEGTGHKATSGAGTIAAGAAHSPAILGTGVQIANTWSGSFTAPVAPQGAPPPGAASIPVTVANTAGNWLFAVVAWRQAPGYPPVTFSVGDGVNHWEPMGAPGGTSPAGGTLRVAVWRAPAARTARTVCAAPTGFCLSAAMVISEVTGIAPWISEVATITAFAASSATLPALAPSNPGTPVLWITAMASGLSTATGTYPASPWQPGPAAATGNGADHTGDLVLITAFQQSAAGVSATWGTAAATDMAGIIAGVQVFATPPPQPNPNWAPGVLEFAFGAGAATPADELTWTPLDGTTVDGLNITRVSGLSFTQGQQYTIGSLQAGQGSVTIDNRDLAVTPPGTGPFAGIDSGTPWRYRIAWAGGGGYPVNPAPHYVLTGYTVDLPATWTPSRRGIVTPGLTDAWAYCQPQIQSALRQEILADNPTHCWPCDASAGALYTSNIAPGSTAALAEVTSKYGGAGAAADFGATAAQSAAQAAISQTGNGGLPGDNGSVWQQSGLPAGATPGGYCLYCQDSAFPPLNGPAGVTIECWSSVTGPAPLQQNGTLWAIKGSKGLIMRLWADIAGALWLTTQDTAGTQVTTSLGAASFAAAGMFQTAVTYVTGSGWSAYVNGTLAAESASAPSLPPRFAWITAGGEADRFTSGGMFSGQTAFLVPYPQALSPARIASHFQAGNAAFSTEPDWSRLERLLGYAGYTGPRIIQRAALPDLCASLAELGTSSAGSAFGGGAPQPTGTSTVQAGQEITSVIASLTPAMLYVSAPGGIVYLPKGLAFGQAPVWVLGEDVDAGEIPYEWDLSLGYDPLRVVNAIQITQVDRQDVVSPQAFIPLAPGFITPAASQAKFSPQTLEINGYLNNDITTPISSPNPSSLTDLANWLGVTLAQPKVRGDKVTIDAAAKPWAWPFVAGASQGDVAVLNRRPITAQASIVLLARVMRAERSISWKQAGAVARVTVTLDYAPELVPLVLDSPEAGQLTGANVLTW
jgi:hypothetical protein